jgi:hypothetical protein
LPSITGAPPPITVTGLTAVALTDRPEVRELMRRFLSPDWGIAWAQHPNSAFYPANLAFNTDNCRAADLDENTNMLREQLCRDVHDAIATGQLRWDGSDLMPDAIGSTAGTKPGAFQQGMLDYVNDGPGTADQILARIEANWQTLDHSGHHP